MATMCDGDGTDCHPRVVVSDGGGVDDVVDWTLLCLDGGWVVDTGVRGRFSDVRLALTVGSPVVAARGSCAPRSSSRTLGTNGEDPGEDPGAASDGVSGESGDATASSSLVSVANDVISTSSGVDASADSMTSRSGVASSGVPGPIMTLVGDGRNVFPGIEEGAGVVIAAGSSPPWNVSMPSLLFSLPFARGLGAISRGDTALVTSRIARLVPGAIDRLV